MARIKSTPIKCLPANATCRERVKSPYTCDICFKEFRNGHQLGGHRKAHRPRKSPTAKPTTSSAAARPVQAEHKVPASPPVKGKKVLEQTSGSAEAPPVAVSPAPAGVEGNEGR